MNDDLVDYGFHGGQDAKIWSFFRKAGLNECFEVEAAAVQEIRFAQ